MQRGIDDICADLEAASASAAADADARLDSHRPAYPGGASLRDTWQRRRPMYAACSTVDFVIRCGDGNWTAITSDFLSFADRLIRRPTTCTSTSPASSLPALPSTFVCITVRDVATAHLGTEHATATAWLQSVVRGADAVELRVDQLASTEPSFVAQQLAFVRRASPDTPVVFTVRSAAEGGGMLW